jgi:hypothetical protein
MRDILHIAAVLLLEQVLIDPLSEYTGLDLFLGEELYLVVGLFFEQVVGAVVEPFGGGGAVDYF